jgi:hypothetical protein
VVFLLAWIFLAAAIASLYAGLSDEGRSFLYLSMAASAATVVLVVVQLRRGSPAREGRPGPEAIEKLTASPHATGDSTDRPDPGGSSSSDR